jgi:hypothetical protein
MNSNDYKVLYQKAEKDKIKTIVQKVKETYEKYDSGKIDFNDLKDVIVNDLQISNTDNFDKLTNSAGRDNKTFAGLIKSLGILKDDKQKAPVFTANQIKNSCAKRYPRYVRNRSYKVPEHKADAIQDSVSAYLKRQINSHELSGVLRENNINPNIEEINKYIRSHDAGINVKFNDMLFAVKKLNNNGVDPSEIKFDFKTPKQNSTQTESATPKGRKKDGKNLVSNNKDLFDWELNEQQQILSKTETQQVNMSAKTKFISESSVFKKDDINNDEKKSTLKKVDAPQNDNGNILTWKAKNGTKNENSPAIEIKRRDPNAASNTEVSTNEPKRKVMKMHESSEENGLVRKK